MKKNLKNYIAFCLIIIVSVVMFVYLFQKSEKQYLFANIHEASGYVSPEGNVKEAGQKFTANDLLCGIQVRFTDVNKTDFKNGSLILGVTDLKSKKILKEIEINANKIALLNPYKLTFDTIKESSQGEYYVSIKFTDAKDDNIGVGYYDSSDAKGSKMVVDGTETQHYLDFSPIYEKTTRANIFLILLISIMLLIFAIYLVITRFKLKLSKSFLLIMAIFLLIGTFAIPLGAGHDEVMHFYKAYDIARGNIMPHIETSESNGQEIIADDFPKAIDHAFADNVNTELDYGSTAEALRQNINNNDTFQYDTTIESFYSPVVYVQSVAGILVAKLFTNNVGIIVYAGRFSSVLFSILILFLIMRILPFGKKIFFVMCLNPMVLSQLCIVSPDTFTLLMCFLFFAYVLKIAYSPDERIKRSQVIILIALAVCVALAKTVYLPLCFSVLLIKKDKFKSIKNYFLFMFSTITASLAIGIGWLAVAKSYLSIFANSRPTDQIEYILGNPLNAVGAGLVSIKNESWNYFLNIFGNKITWMDRVDCGFLVSFTMIFLILVVALFDSSIKDRIKKYQKYLLGGIILASTLLIFISMYVQWSPYAWKYITGVQGRYFIPLLPLSLFLIGSIKVKFDNQEQLTRMIYFLGLFPFAFAMISTLITYL